MLVTLYKISEVHFRLLGRNGVLVKAGNEGFASAVSCCRQNFKYENFTLSFGRQRQKPAPISVPQVRHNDFLSFNQSNHCFVVLSLQILSLVA